MARKVTTPSELDVPAFLMNVPFTVDNREPNNPLMTDRTPYDYGRAHRQWMTLYRALAAAGLVCLMPHDGSAFQDLPFVANLGAFLPHRGHIVLSRFRSTPRQGEEIVGGRFLSSMGYRPQACPRYWEGEADLKFIREELYIGGYGIRTDPASYQWMAEAFDMTVVAVRMTDERLYHFDCLFFPLTAYKALVATAALDLADVRRIEQHLEIIDVPKRYVYDGWTNAVRLNSRILVDMPPTRESRHALEDLIVRQGFEPAVIDLGEFAKSGADLSCLCMHLNFNGRRQE